MAKDIDNPGETDLEEKEEGAETDEEETDQDETDSEDQEEGADDEGDDSDDDSEEDDDSDEEEDSEEGDDDQEDEEGDDEDPDDPMAKFKGKTAEQVVEMYRNLERTLNRKANAKAQELVQKLSKKGVVKGSDKTDKELEEELSKVDFSKMTPKQFAKWTLDQINQRAVNKAQEIFEQASNVKVAVSREIREASRIHPHLKDNADYRDVVIGLIESAAAKGQTLTLREACAKADKAMGIQAKKGKDGEGEGDGKGKDKKKPRTGVEKPTGTDGGKQKTEDEKVRDSIMGGSSNRSDLGGLGI